MLKHMKSNRDKLKLNLGCGHRTIKGFVNIDASRNVFLSRHSWIKKILAAIGVKRAKGLPDLPKDIVWMALPAGLKNFRSNSADRVYSSHFIEHVTQKNAMTVLRESYRILEPGGLFRIVAPDAPIYCAQYLEATKRAIESKNWTSEHRDLLFDSLVGGWHKGVLNSNLFFWDIPSMCHALETVGFTNLEVCDFNSGTDPLMNAADNYEGWSFYIEARKR